MERIFTVAFHIPGTLAADITPIWTAPCDCTLLASSAVATNNSDATMSIGTTSSAAAHLAAGVIGDSSVPVTKGRADFVGGQYPRITAGDVLQVTLDYNGAAGTAAQNVTILLTFAEG